MKFVVPIPEKISLNRIYAGVHFRERAHHKDEYHMAVVCCPTVKPWTGSYPVKMHYHFRLHGLRLDISNHAYMLKMVEDALVSAGVLPGDDQKYVAEIGITAEKISNDQFDEVEVTIYPAE